MELRSGTIINGICPFHGSYPPPRCAECIVNPPHEPLNSTLYHWDMIPIGKKRPILEVIAKNEEIAHLCCQATPHCKGKTFRAVTNDIFTGTVVSDYGRFLYLCDMGPAIYQKHWIQCENFEQAKQYARDIVSVRGIRVEIMDLNCRSYYLTEQNQLMFGDVNLLQP